MINFIITTQNIYCQDTSPNTSVILMVIKVVNVSTTAVTVSSVVIPTPVVVVSSVMTLVMTRVAAEP